MHQFGDDIYFSIVFAIIVVFFISRISYFISKTFNFTSKLYSTILKLLPYFTGAAFFTYFVLIVFFGINISRPIIEFRDRGAGMVRLYSCQWIDVWCPDRDVSDALRIPNLLHRMNRLEELASSLASYREEPGYGKLFADLDDGIIEVKRLLAAEKKIQGKIEKEKFSKFSRLVEVNEYISEVDIRRNILIDTINLEDALYINKEESFRKFLKEQRSELYDGFVKGLIKKITESRQKILKSKKESAAFNEAKNSNSESLLKDYLNNCELCEYKELATSILLNLTRQKQEPAKQKSVTKRGSGQTPPAKRKKRPSVSKSNTYGLCLERNGYDASKCSLSTQ